jgi:hypothetical protein
MFCPTCGRDNSSERRFCASCGTNLDVVSQALSGSNEAFFTKLDTTLDHFIARYAEHAFKDAPANAAEQRIGKSWKVLGQGIATSFLDLLFFILIWNIIPLRFLMLLILTPIRRLSEQGKSKKGARLHGTRSSDLPDSPPQQRLPGSIISVTEHTTEILVQSEPPKQNLERKRIPPK